LDPLRTTAGLLAYLKGTFPALSLAYEPATYHGYPFVAWSESQSRLTAYYLRRLFQIIKRKKTEKPKISADLHRKTMNLASHNRLCIPL
jgi:hypothetical protein